MIDSLAEYETPLTEDGRFDMRLIVTHMPYTIPPSWSGEVRRRVHPFQEHIRNAARDADEMFGYGSLDLRAEQYPGMPVGDYGVSAVSDIGEISDEAWNRYLESGTRNFVQVGLSFDACHGRTCRDLIERGAREIHIPLDCTNAHTIDDYPEMKDVIEVDPLIWPLLSFGSSGMLDPRKIKRIQGYAARAQKRSNHAVHILGDDMPLATSSANGSIPLLVVFYRTWSQMLGFLEEHKRKSM